MKLQIEQPIVDALVGAYPRLAWLQEQMRFGNRAEVDFAQLQHDELHFLEARAVEFIRPQTPIKGRPMIQRAEVE